MFKAASETSNAIRANPQGAHSDDSPFKFRHGLHTFQFYAKHPQKAKRFAEAMAGVSQSKLPPPPFFLHPHSHILL